MGREKEERIGSFRAGNTEKEEPIQIFPPDLFINRGAKKDS